MISINNYIACNNIKKGGFDNSNVNKVLRTIII